MRYFIYFTDRQGNGAVLRPEESLKGNIKATHHAGYRSKSLLKLLET